MSMADNTRLSNEGILKFMNYVNKLKHTPRRGWTIRNIQNHEQVSSHMYSMAMMTFFLTEKSDEPLDKIKCMQLSLVHDLAESIIGDITPLDNIPTAKKHQLEDDAMKEITSHLGDEMGSLIYNLYKEYEAKETAEAKFVKDLDIFDLMCTADFYEKRDNVPGKLQEFFDNTSPKLKTPEIKSLANTLCELREKTIP